LPERLPCEFFLIRYVADPVKGEFTNIGVLLREAGQSAQAGSPAAYVRFTRDWGRVRCLDAGADIGLLEALEGEIAARLRPGAGAASSTAKPVVDLIEDTFSNTVQMSEGRACLAENIAAELELLMKMYVEPLKIKQDRRRTGRAAIATAMRTQFERAGVWALMRKRIAASLYTMPGDPMKIDCGYRPIGGVPGELVRGGANGGVPGELVRGGANGAIKMFHAVSLEADVEAAKVLAWSAPRLREGVARVEGATLELTAVVEPLRALAGKNGVNDEQDENRTRFEDEGQGQDEDQDENIERYRFGVETMEGQQIRVLTMNDLARAAATAKVDLRL
jgi:hypothetical protein